MPRRGVAGAPGSVDLAAAQRALVDEEAEAQVVAGQRRDVRAQPLAGAQAAEDRAGDIAAPSRSWRGKADPALAHVGARHAAWRCRAAARPSAARRRGVRSSASGSASSAATPSASSAPTARSGSRSSSIVCVEHLERVPVDVEVVVDGLLDAAQRLELRQHDGGRAERRRAARGPRARRRRRRCAAARRRRARRRRRCRPRRRASRAAAIVRRVDRRSRARRRAARRAAPAAGRRRRRVGPTIRSAPRSQVGQAAARVERLAAGERLGERVDGEVAPAQVVLDASRPAAG